MPRELPYPAASPPYPVQLDGELDQDLSRWKWLVKWFLAIPHLIVLAFLWLGFVLTSIAALVMVVATGRYPRPLFDFNVGVMRWTWRVGFYAFNAIGTDRYPPFSLAERPDYPARLRVDYPERLNRGLALVKWWLLAIPHYVVMVFYGIGAVAVALAGWFVVLFTGAWPPGMRQFLVRVTNYHYRIWTYVAMVQGDYPKFGLPAE